MSTPRAKLHEGNTLEELVSVWSGWMCADVNGFVRMCQGVFGSRYVESSLRHIVMLLGATSAAFPTVWMGPWLKVLCRRPGGRSGQIASRERVEIEMEVRGLWNHWEETVDIV